MEQNQLAIIKRDVVDIVSAKINEFTNSGELHLPEDYSAPNAMKSAFLILQDTVDRNNHPALEVCTKNSVANALLSMAVQGLNPDKKQAYFICYGTSLTCQRSYFGSMALAKRADPTIEDFPAEVIYEGDKLSYEIVNGKKIITLHEQTFANVNKDKIIGAYAMVMGEGGEVKSTCLMTMDEIKQSWKQSKMKPVNNDGTIKAGSTHEKFTADMAKRTVINKVCKPIINSSSDAQLIHRITGQQGLVQVEHEVHAEIEEKANQTVFTEEEIPEPALPTDEELAAATEDGFEDF